MLTAEKVYAMLGNESLWDTVALCNRLIRETGIDYSVRGGVAVCLHGYQRNTTALDLVVRSDDSQKIHEVLEKAGLVWNAESREFRSASGIAVQFLTAGDSAGKGYEVKVPNPTGEDNVEVVDGLNVVRLSRLIEMKIACGLGNMRRTHKDFADVVELIAIRNLNGGFAHHLHKSVRKTFRDLVKRVGEN